MTAERRLFARRFARWAAAVFFVAAGVNHFRAGELYRRIVPPPLPAGVTVVVSGLAEVAGGLGLLFGPTRRAAAWGLAGLLVAVFPANVYMAVSSDPGVTMNLPAWALWARLPLQLPLVAWVLYAGIGLGLGYHRRR